MINKKIKKDVIKLFTKYCQKCDGRCCKKGMVTFFESEALGMFNEEGGVKSIPINKECIFLKNKKCSLGAKKPIDCVTFPIYPHLELKGVNDNLVRLTIHKSCPYYKEMINDDKLCLALKNLWKSVFKKEARDDVASWLAGSKSWSKKLEQMSDY